MGEGHCSLTPWLTASMSCACGESVRGWPATEKWKAAGSSRAITLIASNEVFSWVAPKSRLRKQQVLRINVNVPQLNPCSEYFKPPTKKHVPRTWTAWILINHDLTGAIAKPLRRLLKTDPTTVEIRTLPSQWKYRDVVLTRSLHYPQFTLD